MYFFFFFLDTNACKSQVYIGSVDTILKVAFAKVLLKYSITDVFYISEWVHHPLRLVIKRKQKQMNNTTTKKQPPPQRNPKHNTLNPFYIGEEGSYKPKLA